MRLDDIRTRLRTRGLEALDDHIMIALIMTADINALEAELKRRYGRE